MLYHSNFCQVEQNKKYLDRWINRIIYWIRWRKRKYMECESKRLSWYTLKKYIQQLFVCWWREISTHQTWPTWLSSGTSYNNKRYFEFKLPIAVININHMLSNYINIHRIISQFQFTVLITLIIKLNLGIKLNTEMVKLLSKLSFTIYDNIHWLLISRRYSTGKHEKRHIV
jgi:hypothetical protein